MASGRPDWYSNVALSGQYDTTLIPVLVDSSGTIISRLKGIHDTTLKDVLLDSGGRIVSVIRDPTSDQYLAVDASGNIIAVMKGDYSGTLKTIAVDSSGIIKANLAVQDLAELTIRTKYGTANVKAGHKTVTASDDTELFSISGKGMVYGGLFWLDHTSTQKTSYLAPVVDGKALQGFAFVNMNKYNTVPSHSLPIGLLVYDDVNFIYAFNLQFGITFETSFSVTYHESHGSTPRVNHNVIYATI